MVLDNFEKIKVIFASECFLDYSSIEFSPVQSIAKLKYRELNEKIERISKAMGFFIIEVSMTASVAPNLILTLIYYEYYGLGEESFQDLLIE